MSQSKPPAPAPNPLTTRSADAPLSNRNYEVFWGETGEVRAFEDRHESTEAHLLFMHPRCAEFHRVLRRTGSFYSRCDWHASHYVKVVLDQRFGEDNFQNEIVWKRQSGHSDARQGSKHCGRVHDVLSFVHQGMVGRPRTWRRISCPPGNHPPRRDITTVNARAAGAVRGLFRE
jgi:adenine specific DNA methylase Mod